MAAGFDMTIGNTGLRNCKCLFPFANWQIDQSM